MGIRVHGSPISAATMRVTACLYEKELDFEFVAVDLKAGAHTKQPFLSLNPFGKVPVLEDGDVKLFESRAITQYIAHKYHDKGTHLVFTDDSKAMANVSQWMEVEAHHFNPVATNLAYELIYKKYTTGQDPDPATVQDLEAKLGQVLDVYEAHLSRESAGGGCNNKYLAGDAFSLADLHHLPAMQVLVGTAAKRFFDERPSVAAWCEDVLARPVWVKVDAMQKQARAARALQFRRVEREPGRV